MILFICACGPRRWLFDLDASVLWAESVYIVTTHSISLNMSQTRPLVKVSLHQLRLSLWYHVPGYQRVYRRDHVVGHLMQSSLLATFGVL